MAVLASEYTLVLPFRRPHKAQRVVASSKTTSIPAHRSHLLKMPLTTRTTLMADPLFLEILVKHYFARVVSHGSKSAVPLRREELL